MLELIFIDLPIGVFSYFAIVFLIMKYMGDQVHDVDGVDTVQGAQNATVAKPQTASPSTPIKTAYTAPQEEALPEHLPTDCVLIRHHITHLIALANEAHPIESFNGSRESYKDRIQSLVEGMLKDPAQITALELHRKKHAPAEVAQPSELVVVASDSEAANESMSLLPEDATLRRHTLQLIVSRLEEHFPRPTESTLIRHYEQWVDSELEKLKACA